MLLAVVALMSAGLCSYSTSPNIRATVRKDFILASILSIKLCKKVAGSVPDHSRN